MKVKLKRSDYVRHNVNVPLRSENETDMAIDRELDKDVNKGYRRAEAGRRLWVDGLRYRELQKQ